MPGAEKRRFAFLWSQGFGVLCGQLTVLLLAVGSVVLVVTRDGASRNVGVDELGGFFSPPAWAHLWLYALIVVLALYALNTLLATSDSIVRKWRMGIRALVPFAAAFIHVGFLVALAGHLVGGIYGAELGARRLDTTFRPLETGLDARVRSLDIDVLPSGMPRSARAMIDLRDADGTVTTHEVGYNEPLSLAWGTRLYLYAKGGYTPQQARVSLDGVDCRLAVGETCRGDGASVTLVQFAGGAGPASPVLAQIHVTMESHLISYWMVVGQEVALPGGDLRLVGVTTGPEVLLRGRLAPSIPWALVGALLVSFGVVLMSRRLVARV